MALPYVHVLLLAQPTVSPVTQGAHMIEALNLLGVDAAVPGNHDFDVR